VGKMELTDKKGEVISTTIKNRGGKLVLKEFTVCYTFDDDIINEKVIKELDVKKEDVEHEIIEKLSRSKYFIVKNNQEIFMINSYLVRYVRVINEKILVL
jgi:hypothetical protein